MFAYVKKRYEHCGPSTETQGYDPWTFHEEQPLLGTSVNILGRVEDCTRDEYSYRNKSADELWTPGQRHMLV